jgi:hypothetical protein
MKNEIYDKMIHHKQMMKHGFNGGIYHDNMEVVV